MSQNQQQNKTKIILFVYEKSFASIVKDILRTSQNSKLIPAFLRGFVYKSKIENIDNASLSSNNILYYDYSCAKIYGFNIELEVNSNEVNNLISNLKQLLQQEQNDYILVPVITENFNLEETYALTVIKHSDIDSLASWFNSREYPNIRYADREITAKKLYNIMQILKENSDQQDIIREFLNAFDIKDNRNISEEKDAIEKVQESLFNGDAYLGR